MIVLGLNIYGHDTAAALVVDGKIVAAIEEERLSRKKHDRAFPLLAIDFCLKKGGVTLDDVDCIAVSKDFDKLFKEKYLQYTIDNFPKANDLLIGGLDNIKEITNVEKQIREATGYKGQVKYCLHHLCHVASSYFLSGFDKSAVLSVDGLGENETTLLGVAEGSRIEVLRSIDFPHSLGMFYQAFTYFLGFIPNSQEGTVMALASFGDSTAKNPQGVKYIDIFRSMVELKSDGTFALDLNYFNFPYTRKGWVSEKTLSLLGEKREKGDEILDKHKDIAAAMQQVFEEVYLHMAKYLYETTGIKNISVAGGCALNCVANGKILSDTEFEDIYIQPAASDSGTSIGAALYAYNELSGYKLKVVRNDTTYHGASFTNEYIEKVLQKSNLDYEKIENPSELAASLLHEGKIIGWFQGEMEFGPRALGNRSILSAPFPESRKDHLNANTKHREWFRPFAPSVLEEYANDYFEIKCSSPFMLLAVDIRKEKYKSIEAVAHVDNTARIQTVRPDTNKKYYDLLNEYRKLSGIPVVLNTSFNDKGEPIVCSPEDALKSFKSTRLDALIIGDFIVRQV